jgi:hypothetical protein
MPRDHLFIKLTFNTKWVNSLADVDMYGLNIGVPRVVFGF